LDAALCYQPKKTERDEWGEEVEWSKEDLVKGINAQEISLGWITNGRTAFNNQPLLIGVRSCEFYQKKGSI